MPRARHRREIAGVHFDFVVHSEVIDSIVHWKRTGQRRHVVLANPHSVMTTRRDSQMRAAAEAAGLCLPDGVGVILAAKLLGYGRRHRVTGPSLLLAVCNSGLSHGLRHFFYGGAPGVAEQLRERLMSIIPNLQIVGTHCPPFAETPVAEDDAVVKRINDLRPDVVWVGLGAPKQEIWMSQHAGRIHAAAMIGVGAAFDFHSGNIKWAPQWVRRAGLEWAHRLLVDPKRMWRRNLDSPLFMAAVASQLARKGLGGLGRKLGVLRARTPVPIPALPGPVANVPPAQRPGAWQDELVASA